MSKEYWVVRVNGGWLRGGFNGVTPNKNERFAYNRQAAYSNAGSWEDARVVKVKVTRKPKAPPPLEVGDEVLVRGKVSKVESSDYRGKLDTKVAFGDGYDAAWVNSALIVRAAKDGQ
jgi:hypothetical protein